jgi:hypothetical protein
VVNNGALALGALPSVADYSFGTFTVNAPGTLETLINGNSQFTSLWGDGTITNTQSTGGPYQLRILAGPCEFSGAINGNVRYYSQGRGISHRHEQPVRRQLRHPQFRRPPAITGVKKIGLNGQPSSIGKGGGIDIRENGGTLLYLGTGETTDKSFLFYPSANRAVIDGGLSGSVTFNGSWSSSGGRLCRLALTGTNSAGPCVFNGSYSETTSGSGGTNYSTYLAKEGPGTWVFKSNAGRANRGVVDVREGTLQFESLAEAGTICSLGRSDLLFSDTISYVTNGLGVPYAFSLGTATTVGTLEYIGTNSSTCTTRKLVLQGNGRLKSDAGALAFLCRIESLTAGAKTLTLDGSGTNALAPSRTARAPSASPKRAQARGRDQHQRVQRPPGGAGWPAPLGQAGLCLLPLQPAAAELQHHPYRRHQHRADRIRPLQRGRRAPQFEPRQERHQ